MQIIFPDNSIKNFDKEALTGLEIAESISKSLAKDAIAIKVNGKLQDLSSNVPNNSKIEIIKDDSEEGTDILRHDAAHILAQAIKNLYPHAQITIGPVIENGFYYDISVNPHITIEDFPKIEKEMQNIIDQKLPLERLEWPRDDAIEYFKNIKEYYKAEIIGSIPQGEIISLYKQGDFIDLCRGPHAPHTGKLKAFKLLKLAGAYWRGDSKNEMLQRIYGTAWASKKELNDYLHMLEEAKKRDHRKIGKEMELFHIQDEAVGQIFWHEKGYRLYRKIEEYIRKKISKHNYKEVKTPQIMDRSFWEKSGHWHNYSHAMFTTQTEDGRTWALKPMNCPAHVQIFNSTIRSYKDLPLKLAEFGCCHRYEPSGSLHGLMRVRGFVQDDAHIFCTREQITEETVKFCGLIKEVYEDFGFKTFEVKFSDRPEKRSGSDEVWDQAENALKKAVEEAGLEYKLNAGEGAFYGPKLEFVLKDSLGRQWQCGTIQVDLVLPERLDASFIGPDGNKHRPVMLHRALLGSLERFIGILIEEFAGKFPLWLSPMHAIVIPITNDFDDYALKIKEQLVEIGAYADVDLGSDKVNYKIRKYSLEKIPLIMVVGAKEVENNNVSIRRLGSEKLETMSVSQLLSDLEKEIKI